MATKIFPAFLREPAVALALLYGVGLVPRIPGTAGTIVAVPAGLFLRQTSIWLALMVCIILAILGCISATKAEQWLGQHDPGVIVIDEYVAMLLILVLLPAGIHWQWLLAAVVIFRFFDIMKPYPVNISGHLPRGFGVMADDLVAAAYTLLLLYPAYYLLGPAALL